MFRFTNSGDITSAKDIVFKVGKTRRLLMRYVCTNNALQTLATTGLGVAQIIRDGKPIVNLNLAEQAKFNDLRYGNVLRASAAGGAVDMNIIVDFSFLEDGNVLPLTDNDYISIPALSTVTIASGAVTIYQDIENGSFLYVPKIYTRTETLSAEKPIFVPDANLYLFMFSEPTTPPTKILLSIDGMLKSDVPYAVQEIVTNADWRIESGTLDFSVIPIGKLANVRGHSYELQMVGGTGTLTYTTVAVDYVPTLTDAVSAAAGGDVVSPSAPQTSIPIQVNPNARPNPSRPRPVPFSVRGRNVVVD
jgi:hypothetical protein